jgi:signal transduction histidine kinase
MIIKHRIQYRLIFFLVTLVIIILTLSGWSLLWVIRQSLETELGKKLESVAGAASAYFDEAEIEYLIRGLGPRTRGRFRGKLLRLKEITDSKYIYIFDLDEKSILDTDEKTETGRIYFRLQFHKQEIQKIQEGKTSHSVLFEGIDGHPTMTGFAPLLLRGNVVGGVAVHGSVTFLSAVRILQQRFYLIGIAGTLAAIILSVFIARTITHPVNKLVNASKEIGAGNYDQAIPVLSKSEIGILAQTMEEMRKGIIGREQQLKAMLAGVAHEIRNPLGGIELFTGLLEDEVKDNNTAVAQVERISKEVSHLKEIVNSFLEYARPQVPRKEECSTYCTIREVASLLDEEIKKHEIQLVIPDKSNKITVWCDPNHLKRILLNLMQNAIQVMTAQGKLRLQVKETSRRVSLIIKDTGPGIPPEIQNKIFTPFFTTREKGTGLGLSIVKGLVEANDGTIRIVRTDRTGTEFEVCFKE